MGEVVRNRLRGYSDVANECFVAYYDAIVSDEGLERAMSSVFQGIRMELEDAIAYSEGWCPEAVVYEVSPLNVKAIRGKVGISQSEFASAIGLIMSTFRHWERGDRKPKRPRWCC